MKQMIITLLFFIGSISPNFAQNTDLNVFKITKSERVGSYSSPDKSYYSQACVNSDGLTIFFNGPEFTPHTVKANTNSKIGGVISTNIDPFIIGSSVYADFTWGKSKSGNKVYPFIKNTDMIDEYPGYLFHFGRESETKAFQMINILNSPKQIFLTHLSCKPEYPTLVGSFHRHFNQGRYNGWGWLDSTFTLNQDIDNSIPLISVSGGWYDIDILGVMVRNVLIYDSTSTRIKAGVLNISSTSPWTLYSESGNKTIYSSSQPKMLEFPTGIYQLDINGSRKQIEIQDALILDGETMEYGKSNLVEENSKWKITNPPDPDPAIPSMNLVDKGIILLHREAGAEGGMTVAENTGVLMWLLYPGMYTVTISGVNLVNVPIYKGCCTRIKAGALNVNSNLAWILYDTNKVMLYTGYSSKKVEFPAGKYQLEVNELLHQVEVKDGETLNFNDSTPGQTQRLNTGSQPWEILTDNTLTGATGQILFQMPTNISYAHLKVFISGDTKMAASLFGNSKSKLLPGNYDLMLDKYSIKNVPVEKGKTTRLKLGILNYSPRGPVQIIDGNNQKIAMAGPFKIALPPGTYYLDGKKEYSFVIKDAEVTEY